MRALNSWFGDPCFGVWKYLEIEYQCLFKANRKIHLFQKREQSNYKKVKVAMSHYNKIDKK